MFCKPLIVREDVCVSLLLKRFHQIKLAIKDFSSFWERERVMKRSAATFQNDKETNA